MATTQRGSTMYDGAQLFMILYICMAEQPIKCQQENIDFQVLKKTCSQMKIYSHTNHKDLQLPHCQCVWRVQWLLHSTSYQGDMGSNLTQGRIFFQRLLYSVDMIIWGVQGQQLLFLIQVYSDLILISIACILNWILLCIAG